jgi:hypothetical protein
LAESNRSDLTVESSVLVRRAAWCGIVFALAMVLTCLNFMPPIDVHYHVRSEVVVSETRLAQLREQAVRDRQALQKGELQQVQLLSVKVLDLAEPSEAETWTQTTDKVVLVEVGSLWKGRCTAERHYAWLKNISKLDPIQLSSLPAASAARFARWELEAARHYQSQHEFLCAKELPQPDPTPGSDEQLPGRQTFQLASFSQPVDAPSATPGPQAAVDFSAELSAQIDEAQQRLAHAESSWLTAIEKSSGALQIAGLPVIAPRSTSIPLWLAASVLILGLATGSTAGWIQYRQHSGGACQPCRVAEQLALDSIPIAGTLRLPTVGGDSSTTLALPQQLVNRTARRMTRLSEWAVTFWVIIATGRFFLDSLWRDVLVESPLAALGRLMAGMP